MAPSTPWTSQQKWSALVIAAIAVTLACLNLGERTFSYHEGFTSATTREMLESGDWIVPRLGGLPRLRKPPLGYWVTALSAICFGELSEFSARLPVAVASLLLVALIGLWSARWYGRSAGLCAALVQATCSIHIIYARQALIDTLLVLLMTAALYLIALQPDDESRQRARLRWLAIYLLLGLTVLAKFHFGPTLVLGTAVAWWLIDRRPERLGKLVHAPGVLLFLILGVTWPVLILKSVPDAISVWRGETLGRVMGEMPAEAPWFFLLAIPGMFLPWTLFLPWFLLRDWKQRWTARDRREQFLAVWACFQVGMISLSSNKHDNYAMPMIPALAIYCAPRLAAMLNRLVASQRPLPGAWLITGLLITPCGMVSIGMILSSRWPGISLGIWSLSAVLGLLICLAMLLVSLRRHTAAMLSAMLAFVAIAVGVFGWLQPAGDYRLPTRTFLRRIRQQVPHTTEVCVFGLDQSTELFYIPGPAYRMENANELRKLIIESGEMNLVIHRYNVGCLRSQIEFEVLDAVSPDDKGFDRQKTPPLMLLRVRPKPEAISLLYGEGRRA